MSGPEKWIPPVPPPVPSPDDTKNTAAAAPAAAPAAATTTTTTYQEEEGRGGTGESTSVRAEARQKKLVDALRAKGQLRHRSTRARRIKNSTHTFPAKSSEHPSGGDGMPLHKNGSISSAAPQNADQMHHKAHVILVNATDHSTSTKKSNAQAQAALYSEEKVLVTSVWRIAAQTKKRTRRDWVQHRALFHARPLARPYQAFFTDPSHHLHEHDLNQKHKKNGCRASETLSIPLCRHGHPKLHNTTA